MTRSVDRYLGLRYDAERFNCLHFAALVWKDETGEDLEQRLAGLFCAPEARHVTLRHGRAFRRLARPQHPCLVILQHPQQPPHVGVFLRGGVIHLTETGVEFVPADVAARSFRTARFFA